MHRMGALWGCGVLCRVPDLRYEPFVTQALIPVSLASAAGSIAATRSGCATYSINPGVIGPAEAAGLAGTHRGQSMFGAQQFSTGTSNDVQSTDPPGKVSVVVDIAIFGPPRKCRVPFGATTSYGAEVNGMVDIPASALAVVCIRNAWTS